MGTRETPALLSSLPERWAERTPYRDAFRIGRSALTYEQLAMRSSQLARSLIDLGVQPGDRVGIFLDKSLETALAVFGILKAGAAYVPLDPSAPVLRLEYMIRHCGVGVLISSEKKRSSLGSLCASCPTLRAVVGVSEPLGDTCRTLTWEDVALAPTTPPGLELTPEALAYIMFTSGSTGMPKGMMHTHGSGMAYAQASQALFQVGPEDRLGNHSPLHFDMSTFEFLTGPLAGSTTVLLPEAYTRMPASLSTLMEQERLTFWYSVPFALIQLLLRGVLEKRDLSSLRWVMFGGEPFPPKYLSALMRAWPKARFCNVYGPAEVNQCTWYEVPAATEDLVGNVPIGQLWDAAEGLLVDEADQPIHGAGTGELLVRGPTRMRGYFNRPDLNARVFFPSSSAALSSQGAEFQADPDCYYRTGDWVQRDAQGLLHFLGRKDRLVKLRGYRIELDEVELSLCRLEAVEEAAVFVSLQDPESPELEAAVLLKSGAKLPENGLQAEVALNMPPYAVPRRIHVLETFPRTTSGKIDRRALQAQFLETAAGECRAETPSADV